MGSTGGHCGQMAHMSKRDMVQGTVEAKVRHSGWSPSVHCGQAGTEEIDMQMYHVTSSM